MAGPKIMHIFYFGVDIDEPLSTMIVSLMALHGMWKCWIPCTMPNTEYFVWQLYFLFSSSLSSSSSPFFRALKWYFIHVFLSVLIIESVMTFRNCSSDMLLEFILTHFLFNMIFSTLLSHKRLVYHIFIWHATKRGHVCHTFSICSLVQSLKHLYMTSIIITYKQENWHSKRLHHLIRVT